MLLKVGKRIVNTDNVTMVRQIGDDVRVVFNVTASGDFGHEPVYIQFSGPDAAALWAYLTSQAVDVLVDEPVKQLSVEDESFLDM